MRKASPALRRSFMSRRWARSAAFVVVVAGLGLGSGLAVLDHDTEQPAPVAVRRMATDHGEKEGSLTAPLGPPARRRDAGEQARRDPAPPGRSNAGSRTGGAASRPRAAATTPDARVSALRDLERRDAAAATVTALRLVHDPVPLVRLNAVAVLARSTSPEATRVLALLDPESRLLAQALAERR